MPYKVCHSPSDAYKSDFQILIPSAGTARDVSLLIDFLPSILYPDDGSHPIVEWAVAGISLGGHATWISLATGTASEFTKVSNPQYIHR